jgi:hypothetical protein
MTLKSVAARQYLGYSLQSTRMLEILLDSEPGAIVSLEVLGDVAVERLDGSVLVEEDKSRGPRDNPLTERAAAFWGTLANWITACTEGLLNPAATEFRLYLAQSFEPSPVVAGLLDAGSSEEAEDALAAAQNALWGTAPKFDRRVGLPAALAKHISTVFNAEKSLQIEVVRLTCSP